MKMETFGKLCTALYHMEQGDSEANTVHVRAYLEACVMEIFKKVARGDIAALEGALKNWTPIEAFAARHEKAPPGAIQDAATMVFEWSEVLRTIEDSMEIEVAYKKLDKSGLGELHHRVPRALHRSDVWMGFDGIYSEIKKDGLSEVSTKELSTAIAKLVSSPSLVNWRVWPTRTLEGERYLPNYSLSPLGERYVEDLPTVRAGSGEALYAKIEEGIRRDREAKVPSAPMPDAFQMAELVLKTMRAEDPDDWQSVGAIVDICPAILDPDLTRASNIARITKLVEAMVKDDVLMKKEASVLALYRPSIKGLEMSRTLRPFQGRNTCQALRDLEAERIGAVYWPTPKVPEWFYCIEKGSEAAKVLKKCSVRWVSLLELCVEHSAPLIKHLYLDKYLKRRYSRNGLLSYTITAIGRDKLKSLGLL